MIWVPGGPNNPFPAASGGRYSRRWPVAALDRIVDILVQKMVTAHTTDTGSSGSVRTPSRIYRPTQWARTRSVPGTTSLNLASATGCRRVGRLVPLNDDRTPHEWCRPDTYWIQVHHPRVPEYFVSVVYCECWFEVQDDADGATMTFVEILCPTSPQCRSRGHR